MLETRTENGHDKQSCNNIKNDTIDIQNYWNKLLLIIIFIIIISIVNIIIINIISTQALIVGHMITWLESYCYPFQQTSVKE